MNELTYPIREAFKTLQVSPPTGYKLIHSGVLKTYKIGRRRYATAEQIQECIERLSKEAAA